MRVAAAALFALAWTGSLRAQDTSQVAPDTQSISIMKPHRDPQRAKVLGTILPGAGHIYAGEYWRGYSTWVVTVSGIGVGSIVFEYDGCALDFFISGDSVCSDRSSSRLLGALLVGAGVWTWISSARDAPRAAERANARRARQVKVAPILEPAAGANRQLNLGVKVGW